MLLGEARATRWIHGERGERSNCLCCGSILYIPADAPFIGRDEVPERFEFDCPRCKSVYSLASTAETGEVGFELAVEQREYNRTRSAARRRSPADEARRDPLVGPALRARDRIAAAERDFSAAVLAAHDGGKSIRALATELDEPKSVIHDLIQAERQRQRKRTRRAPITAPAAVESDVIYAF